jgi:hypothetical protein
MAGDVRERLAECAGGKMEVRVYGGGVGEGRAGDRIEPTAILD